MKKALGFLFAVSAMAFMCVGVQAAQYSAGAETSEPGATVSIPVKVAPSAEGVSETVNGYAVELTYDSTVLTPVEKGVDLANGKRYAENAMTSGVLVADTVDVADSTKDKVVVAWADASPATITGETILANVEFTVAQNTTVASTPIEVRVIQAATNADTLDTTYTVAAGEVILGSEFLLGDIDGNGIVNSLDWSLLGRYTSGAITLEVLESTPDVAGASERAKINSDTIINSLDWSLLGRHTSGAITYDEFTAEAAK